MGWEVKLGKNCMSNSRFDNPFIANRDGVNEVLVAVFDKYRQNCHCSLKPNDRLYGQ